MCHREVSKCMTIFAMQTNQRKRPSKPKNSWNPNTLTKAYFWTSLIKPACIAGVKADALGATASRAAYFFMNSWSIKNISFRAHPWTIVHQYLERNQNPPVLIELLVRGNPLLYSCFSESLQEAKNGCEYIHRNSAWGSLAVNSIGKFLIYSSQIFTVACENKMTHSRLKTHYLPWR